MLAPLSGGKAAALVVLLHGVAAKGDDLLYLARAWQEILPEAEFIVPDAPFPCDYAPELRQWYSLADRAPDRLLAGLREAAAILEAWFDELLASRGLDESRLALAGFSQGAATALYTGLTSPKRLAGIAGFSGALPGRRPRERDPLKAASPPRAWRGGHGRAPLDGRCEGGARNGGRAGQYAGKAGPRPRHRR